MKSRKGFVSNSSSSSFILENNQDKKRFNKVFPNSKTIKCTKLMEQLKKEDTKEFIELLKNDEFWKSFDFLQYNDTNEPYQKTLEDIIEKYGQDVEVTEPADRNRAYNRELCLPRFQDDL